MGNICNGNQGPRSHRRINGLQLPLHYQQVIGWIVLLVTALINVLILVPIQENKLKLISEIMYSTLYGGHVVSQLAALLVDPSEKELRGRQVDTVPEFDRRIHAHVIEGGRCHLCNIDTTSRQTKHCSLCNKCVHRFDHHCNWLNNCIGHRNYTAFVCTVITALLISALTAALCLTDLIYFFVSPYKFSDSALNFVQCNTAVKDFGNHCNSSIIFLIFLITYCLCAFSIACALLHLCCFHIYIFTLGVSTYEYIVNAEDSNVTTYFKCSKQECWKKFPKIRKKRNVKYRSETNGGNISVIDTANGNTNIPRYIATLINNEVDKAKKRLFLDTNKVHPNNENT